MWSQWRNQSLSERPSRIISLSHHHRAIMETILFLFPLYLWHQLPPYTFIYICIFISNTKGSSSSSSSSSSSFPTTTTSTTKQHHHLLNTTLRVKREREWLPFSSKKLVNNNRIPLSLSFLLAFAASNGFFRLVPYNLLYV